MRRKKKMKAMCQKRMILSSFSLTSISPPLSKCLLFLPLPVNVCGCACIFEILVRIVDKSASHAKMRAKQFYVLQKYSIKHNDFIYLLVTKIDLSFLVMTYSVFMLVLLDSDLIRWMTKRK